MKSPATLQPNQLEKFARFLFEHPTFSPLLSGENAQVYAFQVGACVLEIAALETLIATQPHFDAREAKRLLAPLPALARGR